MTAEQHLKTPEILTSEFGYLQLLAKIMLHGNDRGDRTGTGTRGLFGEQLRFDLAAGFPLLTTKRVHLKSVIHELLWFIRGDTNIAYLQAHGVKIWDQWASPSGELGPVYGKQWRAWGAAPESGHVLNVTGRLSEESIERIEEFARSMPSTHKMLVLERDGVEVSTVTLPAIDQLANVIERIKTNPDCRRLIVSAWNVADLPEMALAPCHCLFQFYVANSKLSCHMYQRSADMFLGVPFNIASYALLTQMVAHVTGLELGELVVSFGDCHIYSNHFDQVREQLEREPRGLPIMAMRGRSSIDDFEYGDFTLVGYDPHPSIKAPVSV